MIEPTDEMVQAAQAATCGAESDECMRDALAAAFVERERAAGPELYAVVWHDPYEPRPDGRRTRIFADRDEAVEDAAHCQEQCRQAGRADRYVAYRLAPIDPPESPARETREGLTRD